MNIWDIVITGLLAAAAAGALAVFLGIFYVPEGRLRLRL